MISALLSLAMQAARLVQGPRLARRPPGRTTTVEETERCGYCPVCQAFINLGVAGPDGLAPCPRCGRAIRDVEPLA